MKELRTTEKLIITVATTGAFQGKEANPNLPIQPEEIAKAAYDSLNEGASIIHIHARERETGRPTSDPEILREVIEKGLLEKPYWLSFVMGMRRINRAYMSYSPKLLMQLIDALPIDSMFTVMGVGTDELPATTQSILLGGHLRVGFEDNIYFKKGQLAESNAQLVARAARIGRELGCEIASPAEARQLLNIPPYKK